VKTPEGSLTSTINQELGLIICVTEYVGSSIKGFSTCCAAIVKSSAVIYILPLIAKPSALSA
jgi:hypothetical protein